MSGNVEQWSGKDRGDENFPVGSLLIARRLRPHVHAFYAFARNADDIADAAELAPEEKLARLDAMEAVLTGAPGTPEAASPSAARLRASLAETGVTDAHARELLVAFRRDATRRRYAGWDELMDYCRYSAMPVGRHVLDLHGEARDTWAPSDALCAVLQVLNHLQDGRKDLTALDRCYLPQDLLDRFGGRVEDLLGPAETPGLRGCFDAMLDLCDALTARAAALPPRVRSRRLRLETAVILGLARRLARRLRAGDPVAGRVKLTRADAAASVLAALRFLPDRRDAGDTTDAEEVAAIVRAAGTSFHRGMAVLPPARRAAMYAVYAFCRRVDDIADDDAAPLAAREPLLDAWRARIDAVYAGEATDATTRELRRAVAAFGLRREDFHAVIDGMRMDAEAIVAPDPATLDLYCDRVAAAVGRLSVRVFGDASPAADEAAFHLGRALQLTNILRDIGEDAARGRLYLPAPWLDAEGVPHDPAAAVRHPALPRVAARVAADARGHFRAAEAAMARCDRRAMRPARLMGATYAAILDALERGGWRNLSVRARVSRWTKLRLAVGYYLS